MKLEQLIRKIVKEEIQNCPAMPKHIENIIADAADGVLKDKNKAKAAKIKKAKNITEDK